MTVTELDESIASHPFRPKGIKIGAGLLKSLCDAGRVEMKRGYLEGVLDSQTDFHVLDDDIFITVSFELNDFEYELPGSA